jgi:uncharacterized iron-regulated membrane protein
MIRQFLVWLHRWAGLAMVGFLILVSVTGSLLAFMDELERVVSPQLYSKSPPDVAALDLATLAERAEALAPQGKVVAVSLRGADQAVVRMRQAKILQQGGPTLSASTSFSSIRRPAPSSGAAHGAIFRRASST